MSRLISFYVLIAITIVFLVLFYRVLAGFFIPLFLSIILVVVFRPLHKWLLVRTKGRVQWAAGLTTLAILLCLLLPVGIVVMTAGVQGLRFIEQNNAASIGLQLSKLRSSLGLAMPHFGELLRAAGDEVDLLVHDVSDTALTGQPAVLAVHAKKLKTHFNDLKQDIILQQGEAWDTTSLDELIELVAKFEPQDSVTGESQAELALSIKSKFGILKTDLHGGALPTFLREVTNPTQDDVESLRTKAMEYVRPKLLPVTGATGRVAFQLLFGMLILSLSLYFFLADGPAMIETIQQMLPLDRAYQQELLSDFERTSRAVVLAMLAAAVVQGLTAGVGYVFVGMDYLVLLIMLTTVAALIPFVGPMVVWVPICIYLAFVEQRFLASGLLAVWGLLVVATVDNLVKAAVLHGQSQLHPLLALLSILGGVQALGPIGIVVGPMAVSLLQTLLGIIRREMVHFDEHGYGGKTEGDGKEPNSSSTTADSNTAASAREESSSESLTPKAIDDASAKLSSKSNDGGTAPSHA